MVEKDKKLFGTIIGALMETFGQEATSPRLLGYWMGLKDLSIEQVEYAAGQAIAKLTRMPVPAELRSMVEGGSPEVRAMHAWNAVERAVFESYMADMEFQDRTIHAVIRHLGGRERFFSRMQTTNDEKFLRIEFLKAYAMFAASPPSDEALALLPGESNRNDPRYKPRLIRIASTLPNLALASNPSIASQNLAGKIEA